MNIWQKLTRPILALAPMEDVTDTVFRRIIASCARPDIFFTEFTSVEGLQSEGRDSIIHRLRFTDEERPIVAQIWGMNPENYRKTASELVAMGFDGIDINMGCPLPNITKNGACSALIGSPALTKEIVLATKEGTAGKIPVSVKTRIGIKSIQTEEWLSHLLSLGIDALTVHGRTAAEMSKAPVHWDEIAKAVEIRNSMKASTVILGNGDINSAAEALEKTEQYGLDGMMIGRAVFENPWVFDRSPDGRTHTPKQLLELMARHVTLFRDVWGSEKHYPILKKFYKVYIRGFDGAADWRMRAVTTKSPDEVFPLIDEMIQVVQ